MLAHSPESTSGTEAISLAPTNRTWPQQGCFLVHPFSPHPLNQVLATEMSAVTSQIPHFLGSQDLLPSGTFLLPCSGSHAAAPQGSLLLLAVRVGSREPFPHSQLVTAPEARILVPPSLIPMRERSGASKCPGPQESSPSWKAFDRNQTLLFTASCMVPG